MSRRTDREFLSDILEAVRRIEEYLAGMTFEAFLQDTKTQDAVMRNLEIIGEAAKQVSDDLRDRYQSIPWRSMAGLRDRLIHHYFGVSLDVVWEIVSVELSEVAQQLRATLRDLEK